MTTLYTVPAATSTVVASISVCNRTSGSLTFSLALIKSGQSIDNKNYIYYAEPVAANDTFQIVAGLSLATGDFIQWMGSASGLSITATGVEVT